MKLYSDFAPRRTRQILGDVVALAFIGLWIWLGAAVYRLVMDLSSFGVQMENAGSGFRETMSELGESLGGVPLLGGGIRVPFDGASNAGSALETAGQSQQDAVLQLATGLGWGIAVLPVAMILVVWLVPRLRFVRRASSARAQVASGASIDLLALRALSTQRLSVLATIDADAMGAWRRGDQSVLRRLAQLELQQSGVRLSD